MSVPSPSDYALPPPLNAILPQKPIWQQVATARPENPEDARIDGFDRWLQPAWPDVLHAVAVAMDLPPILPPRAPASAADAIKPSIGALVGGLNRGSLEHFLDNFFSPLTGPRDVARAWFLALCSPQGLPYGRTTPPAIAAAELSHDRAIRGMTSREGGDRARALASAMAGIDLPPDLKISRRDKEEAARLRQALAKRFATAVPLPGGKTASGNLYVTQIAAIIQEYLDPWDQLCWLLDASPAAISSARGFAYGLLARSLAPVATVWHRLHGTWAFENLFAPVYLSASVATKFSRTELVREFARLTGRSPLREADQTLAKGCEELASRVEQLHVDAMRKFLSFVEKQSGGRISFLAPGTTMPLLPTGGKPWEIWVMDATQDPGDEPAPGSVPAGVSFTAGVSYEIKPDDPNILWLLRSAWPQFSTALALINQAGVKLWLNAGNNRWGGKHVPHDTHRQGVSIDLDVGFGTEVPDVKQLDGDGYVVPGKENARRQDCLFQMDRLAVWIGIQAFMAVGITQYLFGDDDIVDEAGRHFATRFGMARPSSLKRAPSRGYGVRGIFEAQAHHNHLHFEFALSGEQRPRDGWSWRAPTARLFDDLHRDALLRDQDPSFWRKMARLGRVPTSEADFDRLDPRWKAWWARAPRVGGRPLTIAEIVEQGLASTAGIPLLPVWVPSEAPATRDDEKCMKKRSRPRSRGPSAYA